MTLLTWLSSRRTHGHPILAVSGQHANLYQRREWSHPSTFQSEGTSVLVLATGVPKVTNCVTKIQQRSTKRCKLVCVLQVHIKQQNNSPRMTLRLRKLSWIKSFSKYSTSFTQICNRTRLAIIIQRHVVWIFISDLISVFSFVGNCILWYPGSLRLFFCKTSCLKGKHTSELIRAYELWTDIGTVELLYQTKNIYYIQIS